MRTSSFTSRSSAGTIPVLALAAVLSAAFSWHAKRHWQVESAFFSEAVRTSERYAGSLRAGHPHLFVVFGGSTSRASWIPSVLLDEFGVPVVNFGLHAGFGRDVITELAMREAKPGDTVVVAFEPGYLAENEPPAPTSSGIDFFLATTGLSFARNPFFRLHPGNALGYLRSSTRYNCYRIMKRIRRMKPYRYTAAENLHEDGWMEVKERRDLPDPVQSRKSPRPMHLGKEGKAFLLKLSAMAASRGCRIVYAIPPHLDTPTQRGAFAHLLRDVLPLVPVVKDPLLGVNENRSEFADTVQHPLRLGAERATRSLGEALSHGAFWSREELDAVAQTCADSTEN